LKLLILKILQVTRFKDPKSGDFDNENAEAACYYEKLYRSTPVSKKLIPVHFPPANERPALENIDQAQRREF
jgi:hypothetical protein